MKVLKRIFLFISLAAILIAVAGTILANLYEKEVKNFFISRLNDNLKTEVKVKDYNFSFLKKFPNASLEFKEVFAKEVSKKEDRDTLFYISSVFFEFSLKDVFNENYRVKSIHVRDGQVSMRVNEHGRNNYVFWEESQEESRKFSFELKRVLFENITFLYENKEKEFMLSAQVKNALFSGNFNEKKFLLKTNSELYANKIIAGGLKLLRKKKLFIDTEFEVNTHTNHYKLQSSQIQIENLRFLLSGDISRKVDPKSLTSSKMLVLDLETSGKQLPLEDLISLFPSRIKEKFEAYEAMGIITYDLVLAGKWGHERTPFFNVNFEVENGTVKHKNTGLKLEKLNSTGVFTNGDQMNSRTTELYLDKFEANLGESKFKGDFKIRNFDTPYIRLNSSSEIYLDEALPFLGVDTIQSASGKVYLDLRSSGAYRDINDIKPADIRAARTGGILRMENVSFDVEESPYECREINGIFKFNNNDVKVENFRGLIQNSDFKLNGYFRNFFSFMFFEKERLQIKANLVSEKVVLHELLQKSSEKGAEKEDYKLELSPYIDVSLNTRVRELHFREFSAEAITADFRLKDRVLFTDNYSFNSMDGKVEGSLKVDGRELDELYITTQSELHDIDIRQLFHDFENFGQPTLTSENIQGSVSAEVQFISAWNRELKIDADKVYTLAEVEVENGKLLDFSPLLALSKYIEVEELKNVAFSTFSNKIEIKNKTIFIPQMEIESSALNMAVKGQHGFDNTIDYRIKLKLEDLLWAKAKKSKAENNEFGYEVDEQENTGYLFLKMTGKAEDPKISYDTKGLTQKWKSDIKEEKQTLKSILNEEFGLFKGDTTVEKNNTGEEDEPDPFEIEWEEAEDTTSDRSERKSNSQSGKKENDKKEKKDKSGISKFFKNISEPNEEEYVQPDHIE